MKIDFLCAVLHIDIVFCVWYSLVTKRKPKSKRRIKNDEINRKRIKENFGET